MNRIDRLTAILIHIQGRRRTAISVLQERFNVSKRTLFRDIKSLIEAGVPIGGDAGEGYFIVAGYHLPPVVFNKEEAGAILTGFKMMESYGDLKTSQTFAEALYKIKAVLKYRDKEFLEKLENQVRILPTYKHVMHPIGNLHLEELQYALGNTRVLQINYQTPYSETTTDREIEPLGLVNYSSNWHLIAFCRMRQSMRNFRMDRVLKLNILSETFDAQSHPDYMSFLEETLAAEALEEVVVSFTKMVSRFMGDQKYQFGFVDEKTIEDRVKMKFFVHHIDYFARWLLSFGDQVEIVSPLSLSVRIQELIKELSEHHRMY